MQRQQAATQQQYLELLRHLVTIGVPPPPSVLTLALQLVWTSESGPAELSVHLTPAAGASDVSVPELHSYSDGVYSTSSA
jgi:hypothetical protein